MVTRGEIQATCDDIVREFDRYKLFSSALMRMAPLPKTRMWICLL